MNSTIEIRDIYFIIVYISFALILLLIHSDTLNYSNCKLFQLCFLAVGGLVVYALLNGEDTFIGIFLFSLNHIYTVGATKLTFCEIFKKWLYPYYVQVGRGVHNAKPA